MNDCERRMSHEQSVGSGVESRFRQAERATCTSSFEMLEGALLHDPKRLDVEHGGFARCGCKRGAVQSEKYSRIERQRRASLRAGYGTPESRGGYAGCR